jgi:hypothetical protein
MSGDVRLFIGEWTRRVAAVFLCLLPRRHWDRLESYPLSGSTFISAILTTSLGVIVGVGGYFVHMGIAVDAINTVGLGFAAKQVAENVPKSRELTTSSLQMASMLGFFGYMFMTPQGLTSLYCVLSGYLRMASYAVDHPVGDPALTLADAWIHAVTTRARQGRRRRARQRLEGFEQPDRLVTGKQAGVEGADYVLIASRRKADWTAGTIVVTTDTWYRIGNPYDVHSPEGLRAAYPLTALHAVEVLRRYVHAELPPLDPPESQARP